MRETLDEARARLEPLMAEALRRKEARAREPIAPEAIARGGDLVARGLPDGELIDQILAIQRSIYGDDDRRDFWQVKQLEPAVGELCGSVAALLRRRDLAFDDGRYHLATRTYGVHYRLCPSETFFDQPSAALGTAWVIDKRHVVTAGHCIEDALKGRWQDAAFVFGFAMTSAKQATVDVAADQVYFAEDALFVRDNQGEDWAILRTDRPLPMPALKVREVAAATNEAVAVIGHPCGLPVKYAAGARVTEDKNAQRFFANLDTFGGNSGSPVIDKDHEVVGMLVRGKPDWLSKGNCFAAQVYPDTGEGGEEVLRASCFRHRRPGEQGGADGAAPAGTEFAPTAVVAAAPAPTSATAAKTSAAKVTTATAPLPNAHALLIQITSYQDAALDLPRVRDAGDLEQMLGDPARCGFPPDQIKVLEDRAATRKGILAALKALAVAINTESIVFIYFSGHGGQIADQTHLIPYDVDRANAAPTSIAATELAQIFAALPAAKIFMVFDCCHAGGFEARDVELPLPITPGISQASLEVLGQGRGWALFAAAGERELSYVMRGATNGVFTKHLLGALAGNRPSTDGFVSVFDVYEYVYAEVVKEVRNQHPMFKCSLNSPFRLARHGGGLVSTAGRPREFLYDAVLCYAGADWTFVRDTLAPRFKAEGLEVATSNSILPDGLSRIVGLERGLKQARRVLVIVSRKFLRPATKADALADRAVLQALDDNLHDDLYRVVPVYIEDPDRMEVPGYLRQLAGVRLGSAAIAEYSEDEQLERLVKTLRQPVPRRY